VLELLEEHDGSGVAAIAAFEDTGDYASMFHAAKIFLAHQPIAMQGGVVVPFASAFPSPCDVADRYGLDMRSGHDDSKVEGEGAPGAAVAVAAAAAGSVSPSSCADTVADSASASEMRTRNWLRAVLRLPAPLVAVVTRGEMSTHVLHSLLEGN
jgi:hypothetical protein